MAATIETPLEGPTLGGYLAMARKQRRVSQETLGNVVGRDRTTIGSWENGESYPRLDQWRAMADFLQAPWLLDLGGLPSTCVAA